MRWKDERYSRSPDTLMACGIHLTEIILSQLALLLIVWYYCLYASSEISDHKVARLDYLP